MPELIQRSFTGGEISPALRSRADLAKYSTGLGLCQDFIIRPQGGVYSRPGFKFIGEVGQHSRRARLVPFSFNTTQTYILVFEHLTMRVIKDGGYVLSGGVPYEIVSPYTEAQLSRLQFAQDADVMTITHPDHDPYELSRSAHDSWTLAALTFSNTMTAPTLNSVTDNGTGPGSYTKTYEYVVTAVNETTGVESEASNEVSNSCPSLTDTYYNLSSWSSVAGADYYRVYKAQTAGNPGVWGWIGDVMSPALGYSDFNFAPDMSDTPPESRTPFANTDDKPACVGFFQQRRIFARTNNEPQTLFTSQVGIYDSMRRSRPARDDDSIEFTIKAQQVNEVRHIVALDSLMVLTSGGAWKITEGENEVLTPSTIGAKQQIGSGGASWVRPVIVQGSVLYVQDKGTKIRDLNYEFVSNKFTGNDLSIMANHLFDGYEIEELAYTEEPYGIVWAVRSDGRLLGLTYQREHQVWGWHQHKLAGTDAVVESVASISESGRDALYISVKRTINGSTVRYIERLESREESSAADCFYVDSGLSYSGSAATVMSGLDHLEGEEVVALADGNVVTGLTVSSGQVTLPRAASTVHIGLAYTPTIELLDIDLQAASETLKARVKSISEVTVEVYKSRGGWIGGLDDERDQIGDMREIKPRRQSDGYDAISLKTFKQSVTIDPNWNQGGGLRIEQRAPLPLSILSVVPKIDVG